MPDERERAILREAYRLLVTERLNAVQVAERLNVAGMLTRQAQQLRDKPTERKKHVRPNLRNPESLRRILANETLATGVAVWGAVSGGKSALYPRNHKTRVKRDGTAKWRGSIETPPTRPSVH